MTITTLKKTLKELEKEQLIEIIIELAKYEKKNLKFLDVFLNPSDKVNFEQLVQEAKNNIYTFIYGKSVTLQSALKLREARNVISDFSKLVKNNHKLIADLRLFYIETCNDFTIEFGDISESFYESVASMFTSFCRIVKKEPDLYEIFKDRIEKLYNNSRNFGWSYSDEMGEIYYELLVNLGIKVSL